jgi:hypothetical protein
MSMVFFLAITLSSGALFVLSVTVYFSNRNLSPKKISADLLHASKCLEPRQRCRPLKSVSFEDNVSSNNVLTFVGGVVGSARDLLQHDLAIPPASNTSLPVPTFTYTLGSPVSAPAQGPSSLLAQLGSLVPASAPISSVADQVHFHLNLVCVGVIMLCSVPATKQ